MTYQLLPATSAVMRTSDSATIPADPGNTDWQVYQAWLTAGNQPVPAPGPSVTALEAYAATAQAKILAAGATFNVAAAGATAISILCDGTTTTRADLALLALFGQTNPTGTKTWLDNNNVVTSLTGAELVTLATLCGNWVAATYPALASLLAGIAANPPVITTTAQIDAFIWPAS